VKKIRSAYGVEEYQLGNGLRVLYRRETSAPVVAVCVTYHVGSRNEAKGHTGSTHILEHLLFKDSKNFNKENGKEITHYLDWLGASINATTWLDRTNYFELLPKEGLEEALFLEADRMRDSLFTDEDLASEMPVVRNEFERSRNNPFELLDEEIMAKAFTVHPYRIPTIGTQEDIEGSTAAKLREFYNIYYWPNNATLMVVGDVPWATVEKLVEKYFGPIPSAPHKIPELKVKEPEQTEPRSVSLKRAMGVSIAALYYKIPEGTHKDYPAVLASTVVLAGGYSSRLQKALVDTGLAADVSTYAFALRDPAAAVFMAHVADGVAPQSVLKTLRKEIEQFAQEGPTAEELQRAQERLSSMLAPGRDGIFVEAKNVSEALAAGDWMLAYRLKDEVQALTPKAVAKAAAKYFVKEKETSGVLTNTN
jgi:zinc protease